MPTVRRFGPYRLFFYASDGHEPKHVHVQRDNKSAKFWLNPVKLGSSTGFGQNGLRRLGRLVRREQILIERNWDEFFGDP